MNKPFCFCTLAFGDAYVKQLHRLRESIRNIYPDVEIFTWVDTYPTGAKRHKESPYGFKVHAINHARSQGFDRIIWMDTACILQKKVDYWFDLVKYYGVVAAKDDNKLIGCIGDRALSYYGNPSIEGYHLVGGSLFVFDFSDQLCKRVFKHWEDAEIAGAFADEKKHRHDEACMSMALYLNGCEPTPYDICRYNNAPDPLVIKKHFK